MNLASVVDITLLSKIFAVTRLLVLVLTSAGYSIWSPPVVKRIKEKSNILTPMLASPIGQVTPGEYTTITLISFCAPAGSS